MNVREVLNKQLLDQLSGWAVEELAPSLGSIVYGFVSGSSSYPYVNPDYYLKNTVFTDNFKKVLEDIFSALENGGTYATMLNLDMGTGKTHLMALIFHLYSTIPPKYEELKISARNKIKALEDLGYSLKTSRSTAILPIDFRHSSFKDMIKAFEKSLRFAGDEEAARYLAKKVEESRDIEIFNDISPRELADKINRRTNLIILLDEVFYGVFHLRDVAGDVLRFVTDFVSARRKYSDNRESAVVLLAATARKDYDRWVTGKLDMMKENRRLVDQVESFIEQLSRILTPSETIWLNAEEGLRVVYSRLGLRDYDPENPHPFSSHFREFVERIIKADSDIPQAQHLRSLIKAMALFAKAAYEEDSPWITPAHFSEDILSVLFSTEQEYAIQYKSMLSQSITYAREKANKALEYAIKAVYASSVTGDIRKLFYGVIAAKSGIDTAVPSADEKYIESVLQVLGFKDDIIAEAIKLLDGTPNLLPFKTREIPRYTIVPYENLDGIYAKLIEQRMKELHDQGVEVAKEIIRNLPATRISGGWYEIRVEESLPSKIERMDNNKLYLYVLVNKVKEDDVRDWLMGKGHNLVILLPDLNDHVLQSIIRCKAIYDSTQEFLDHYLSAESILKIRVEKEMTDLAKRFSEMAINDMIGKIRDRLCEAFDSLSDAFAIMLSKVFWYTPQGVTKPVSITVKKQKSERPYIRHDTAKQNIKEALDKHIGNLIDDYASQLGKALNFYYMARTELIDAIEDYILNYIREREAIELSPDMNVLELRPSQYFIITPKALESIIKTLHERLSRRTDVESSLTDNTLTVKRKLTAKPGERRKEEQAEMGEFIVGPQLFADTESLIKWLFKQLDNVESVQIQLNIDKLADPSVKLTLMSIRNYVKECVVKTKDGSEIKCLIQRVSQK
jgi:predicted RecB family endonuclease